MKIDCAVLAWSLKNRLKKEVARLVEGKIYPALAVILSCQDESTGSYIKQKQRIGQLLGIAVQTILPPRDISQRLFKNLISKLNNNSKVQGIIIQRPCLLSFNQTELNNLVIPAKDVDGFHPLSNFAPPVGRAVFRILQEIHRLQKNPENFTGWLKQKKILLVGRGETGGWPISKFLNSNNITNFRMAHSQTKNLKELALSSDIIISCVGRPNIVRHDMIRPSAILIGVGMHFDGTQFQADYDQTLISQKAAFYTPVPKGVGPLNVAYLYDNLLKACRGF